ncbi:unnamed protein product [Danaus chrysippus]|uniref:(African queen) hypothetical protein n=1 Tax=Danaus chrysippus TaxID=151541 RepID=A0A8J2QPR9_9NEOP|nr:unnamed protein product [Danaus chrysippus]
MSLTCEHSFNIKSVFNELLNSGVVSIVSGVLNDCRECSVLRPVRVAQDCEGAVCSLAEAASGFRFSEPCSDRAASRVTSSAKLKYPRYPAFHSSHKLPPLFI